MAAECAVDQLLGGRYALIEVLGHGASGVVWRARDQLLQRDVAVKEIRFPLVVGHAEDASLREAILREARAAARLNHTGAVTVYDVVEEDGRPLIVMELVDAPTLADLVEDEGPLAPERAAAIGVELLDTLDAGHAAGIVHRDVKPRNVMVSPTRVRLADFGVAAVLDDARMTSGNAVIGSPAFMAPEQVTGGEIGAAADLWSLGATLYYAVEGRPPYDKGSAIPTMTAIVLEPPRPPERAGGLTPLLEALLAKDPAARPAAPFLRLWLANLAGGRESSGPAGRGGPDATSQFPAMAPEDIEVPGPHQPPAGPLVPGPASPGGPDVVVIPKSTPSEVPPPGPTVPPAQPTPMPEPTRTPEPTPIPDPVRSPVPSPEPGPAPTEPGPAPMEPERVPSEPDPERVPPEPAPTEPGPAPTEPGPAPMQPGPAPMQPGPAPMQVSAESDTLLDPPTPDATRPRADRFPAPSPAGARSTPGQRPRRGLRLVAGAAAVAAVVLVVVVLAGRGDKVGESNGGERNGGEGGGGQQAQSTGTSASVPVDWVPYVDPGTGFTISHPPGWTVDVDGSLTDFTDPVTGAYLRVDHVEPPGPSPEGAWLDFEPRFAAENAGYRRIRIEPTTYAGFPAAIWEFTYGGGGARLRAVDLGFVTGRYGFALNFQTPEAEWNRLQPVFEAFKAGFRAPAS